MPPSARLQQSLQVHKHTEVWPSRKGGAVPSYFTGFTSPVACGAVFGHSSNCYFATVLVPELRDILWPITLEVITPTIVVPVCGCGAVP